MTGNASPRRGAAALSLVLAAALLLPAAGCGKKGPPKPPLRVRPEAPKSLQAVQRGDTVWISLRKPSGRTDGSDFQEPVRIRLLFLPGTSVAELPGAKAKALFRGRGVAAWRVDRADWPRYAVGNRLEIPIAVSSLGLKPAKGSESLAGRKVSFAAEVLEGKRKRSELAGPVPLTLCAPPGPPQAFTAKMTADGARLSWRPPAAQGLATHVYRAEEPGVPGDKPQITLSSKTGGWTDSSVVQGKTYRYEVRFATTAAGSTCESTPVSGEVKAVDTFPPAAPTGLAAAAEGETIRLFWTPGPELDLAGYIVYRKEDDGEFHKLTPSPITETTYADADVHPGVLYTYVVTAVDGASPPNESGRSEPASERVH